MAGVRGKPACFASGPRSENAPFLLEKSADQTRGCLRCDGSNFAGKTCANFSTPGGAPYYRGTLECSSNCIVDTSGCNGFCGDGVLDKEAGETCDGEDWIASECSGIASPAKGFFYGGALTCGLSCLLDTSGCNGFCGNSVIDGDEDCDGSIKGNVTCQSAQSPGGGGFYQGTVGCKEDCRFDTSKCIGYCGDGKIDYEAGEECEGTNLGGVTCQTVGSPGQGPFYGGILTCKDDCRFETKSCKGYCGNGTIDSIWGEFCDGPMIPFASCKEVQSPGSGNWHGGQISCGPSCQLDFANCEGYCGDGVCQTDGGESQAGCPLDCDRCGNNLCEPEETAANCCHDCASFVSVPFHNGAGSAVWLAHSCSSPETWDQLQLGETVFRSVSLDGCLPYQFFPSGSSACSALLEVCYVEEDAPCKGDVCIHRCEPISAVNAP